jgi:hypothetical protein
MKNLLHTIVFILTTFNTSNGQIKGFLKSNQTQVVSGFLSSQIFSMRTDYVLEKEDGKYGRENQDFFSFAEAKVILLETGYFVGNQCLMAPWEKDTLFSEYRSMPGVFPSISNFYLKNPGQDSYSMVTCDTMFQEGGLSYFRLTDSLFTEGMRVVAYDSITTVDWLYSHRVYRMEDSLRVDAKTLNVSRFKSINSIISALRFSSQFNSSTQSRDAFCFDTQNNNSGIQFYLLGYIDETDIFHPVKYPKEVHTDIPVETVVDSSLLMPIILSHEQGFLLANQIIIVNGHEVVSDSKGRIFVEKIENLSINGYRVRIDNDLNQIVLFYEKDSFKPIKKQRKK